MERLTTNLVRCDVLHSMLSFVTLRILNHRQMARLAMHA
jgi:hypothetical protein